MNKWISLPVLYFGLISVVHSETMGLFFGRSPDLSTHSGISAEVGANIFGSDVYGARLNFSLSETLVLYGDIGLGDVSTGGYYRSYYNYYSYSGSRHADGIYYGGGALYQLSPLVPNFNFVLRGSFHTGDFESGTNYDVSYSEFSVDVIAGLDEQLNESGIQAYAIVGIERISTELDGPNDDFFVDDSNYSDTDLTLGAGMVMPLTNGELYAGVRVLGGFSLGGGYRFRFQ